MLIFERQRRRAGGRGSGKERVHKVIKMYEWGGRDLLGKVWVRVVIKKYFKHFLMTKKKTLKPIAVRI